jgi:hypothetical protein
VAQHSRPRSKKSKLGIPAVAAAVFAGLGLGWIAVEATADDQGRQIAANEFARAWSEQDFKHFTKATADGAVLQAEYDALVGSLRDDKVSVRTVATEKTKTTLSVEWTVKGATWTYTTTAPFKKQDGEHKVDWSPTVVHPQLATGAHFEETAVKAARGDILDVAGASMKDDRTVAPLVGRLGTPSKEAIEQSNGELVAGDTAGVSGLQQSQDDALRGTNGLRIDVVKEDQKSEVFSTAPVAGANVRTTIDRSVQQAADKALAGSPKPSTIVAVQASTGNVLAVAHTPVTGTNIGFVGRYPPGSSFKIVSAYAALGTGITPDTTVSCPKTTVVGGVRWRNAEDHEFGDIPFIKDFSESCNTAFASISEKFGNNTLSETAGLFGIGNEWSVGVPAYTGSVPTNTSGADKAAATFGQGRNLVSPLVMANVAAGVASGSHNVPTVVLEPAPQRQPAKPLDPARVDALRSLMREVVVSGTGHAVRNVKGGPVHGKTGTAEFGTDNPPKAHAWFVGFQGDIAFASFVEGGEFGADAAAPLIAKFLNNIAG